MLNAVVYELPEVPEVYWDFAKEYGTIYQSRPYCELLVDNNIELIVVAVYDDDDIRQSFDVFWTDCKRQRNNR